jgi:hypothetical protein
VIVVEVGLNANEKSEMETLRFSVALCPPLTPVTTKLSDVPETEPSPVTFNVAVCPGMMLAGVKEHEAGEMLVQDRLTLPVNPKDVAEETLKEVESVVLMMDEVAVGADREYATTPVPESETVWGAPPALSAMVRVPLRVPVAVGVKITEIVQFCPTFTPVPQLSLLEKSPLAVTPVIVRKAVPVFESVTV